MLIWNELVSLILLGIGLIMVIPYVIELIPMLVSSKKRKKTERYVLIMATIGWSVLATNNIMFNLDNAWYWLPVIAQFYLVFSTLKELKDLPIKEESQNNFIINLGIDDKNIDPQELAKSISQALNKKNLE